MAKFIFVTGGVVSGLGKGITAASLGRLLKCRGLKVASQKLDPYVNVDPGTMSPLQHGEVFVTDDGKEYDILLYFINRPGHLVNKNTLAESVWGDHIDQVDNFDFIYAQIKNLRKKLKDSGATIEIKAVYGFGYKMVVE